MEQHVWTVSAWETARSVTKLRAKFVAQFPKQWLNADANFIQAKANCVGTKEAVFSAHYQSEHRLRYNPDAAPLPKLWILHAWSISKRSTAQRSLRVNLPLFLTNQALYHERVGGSGCIDPHFLDPDTGWRWVIRFTPRPLEPRGKSSRYPLGGRLGGPQNRYGRRGEEKILNSTGTRTPAPRSSSP
jgi:hypothetical protein